MPDPILQEETITITLGVGTLTANVALADATWDITHLTPVVTSIMTLGTQEEFIDTKVDVDFLAAPPRVRATRGFNDGVVTVRITVLRWDVTEVAVSTGPYTYTAAAGVTVAVPAVDLTKTFVLAGNVSTVFPSQDLDDNLVRWMLTDATTITFASGSANAGTRSGTWFMVEDLGDNFNVRRVVALAMAGVTADAVLAPAVSLDRTMTVCSQSSDLAGGNAEDMAIGFMPVASAGAAFRTTRVANGGTTTTDAFIITFTPPSGITMKRGIITIGVGASVGTENHAAVDLAQSFAHCPMAVSNCSSDAVAFRQAAWATVEQSLATQVQVNSSNQIANTVIVPWELLSFGGSNGSQPSLMSMNF